MQKTILVLATLVVVVVVIGAFLFMSSNTGHSNTSGSTNVTTTSATTGGSVAVTTSASTANTTAAVTSIQATTVSGPVIFPSQTTYSLNQNGSAKYGWNTGEYVSREIQSNHTTLITGSYSTTNPPWTAPGQAGPIFVGILTPAQFSNFTAGKDTLFNGYPYLQGPGGSQACVYCGLGIDLATAVQAGTYYMVLANINYVGQYSGQYNVTITKSYVQTPSSNVKILFPAGSSYSTTHFLSEITFAQNTTITGTFGGGTFVVYTPGQYANYSADNYVNLTVTNDTYTVGYPNPANLNISLPAGEYYFGFSVSRGIGGNAGVLTNIVAIPTQTIT